MVLEELRDKILKNLDFSFTYDDDVKKIIAGHFEDEIAKKPIIYYERRGVSIMDCIDIFFSNLEVDLKFDIAQDYQDKYFKYYFPEIEKRFKKLKDMIPKGEEKDGNEKE